MNTSVHSTRPLLVRNEKKICKGNSRSLEFFFFNQQISYLVNGLFNAGLRINIAETVYSITN